MSKLTPCNRCNLKQMQRLAHIRGIEVFVEVVICPDDPMRGWTSARYSDEPKPSAWFQALTEACAC